MIYNIFVDVEILNISLSFLGALVGAGLGGLINIWIHKSSLKNIRIENNKNWKNNIKTTLINKTEAKSPEDLLKVVTDGNLIAAYDQIVNWDKKDNTNMNNQESKELINDKINLDEEEVLFHE